MIYKSKYFIPQELVPFRVYDLLQDESILLVHWQIRITADQIRHYFCRKMFVNDYIFGGNLQERGFRLRHSETGAKNSEHKNGNALDFIIEGLEAEEIRQETLKKQYLFPFIKRMERDTKGWVHIDRKQTGKDKIILFRP